MNRLRRFHDQSRAIWVLSFVFLLLLIADFVLFRLVVSAQSPTATPVYSDADNQTIQGLRQALSSDRLNNTDRQALQKKLEYSERLAGQQAGKPVTHGSKGTLVPPVPMPALPLAANLPPTERIIQGSEGIIHSWEASINNLWEGAYNGVQYQVLAGSAPDDPSQGLLIVFEFPTDPDRPVRHTYPAPAQTDSLHIVERQGGRLQCAAANGTTLFFDLETRTFQP
jgi:hypothetical protein